MTDPRATSDPAGCVIHGFGAMLLCAAVGAVAMSVANGRLDLAGIFALPASIVFAGLAVSDALRRRR